MVLSENLAKFPIGAGFRISGLRERSAVLATEVGGEPPGKGSKADGLLGAAVVPQAWSAAEIRCNILIL